MAATARYAEAPGSPSNQPAFNTARTPVKPTARSSARSTDAEGGPGGPPKAAVTAGVRATPGVRTATPAGPRTRVAESHSAPTLKRAFTASDYGTGAGAVFPSTAAKQRHRQRRRAAPVVKPEDVTTDFGSKEFLPSVLRSPVGLARSPIGPSAMPMRRFWKASGHKRAAELESSDDSSDDDSDEAGAAGQPATPLSPSASKAQALPGIDAPAQKRKAARGVLGKTMPPLVIARSIAKERASREEEQQKASAAATTPEAKFDAGTAAEADSTRPLVAKTSSRFNILKNLPPSLEGVFYSVEEPDPISQLTPRASLAFKVMQNARSYVDAQIASAKAAEGMIRLVGAKNHSKSMFMKKFRRNESLSELERLDLRVVKRNPFVTEEVLPKFVERHLTQPYAKPLDSRLWHHRLTGEPGIARKRAYAPEVLQETNIFKHTPREEAEEKANAEEAPLSRALDPTLPPLAIKSADDEPTELDVVNAIDEDDVAAQVDGAFRETEKHKRPPVKKLMLRAHSMSDQSMANLLHVLHAHSSFRTQTGEQANARSPDVDRVRSTRTPKPGHLRGVHSRGSSRGQAPASTRRTPGSRRVHRRRASVAQRKGSMIGVLEEGAADAIEELDLSQNPIRSQAAQELASWVPRSKMLVVLKLANCGLRDAVLGTILKELVHRPLTTLDLSANELSLQSTSGKPFPLVDLVRTSTSLTSLNLAWNTIGHGGSRFGDGAVQLASALARTKSIKTLSLAFNALEHEAGYAVAESMCENSSISDLNVSHCQMGPREASILFSALTPTSPLLQLDVSGNPIGRAGGRQLVRCLYRRGNLLRKAVLFEPVTIDLRDCNLTDESADAFDPEQPPSSMVLNLADGYQRHLVGLVLQLTSERPGLTVRSASFRPSSGTSGAATPAVRRSVALEVRREPYPTAIDVDTKAHAEMREETIGGVAVLTGPGGSTWTPPRAGKLTLSTRFRRTRLKAFQVVNGRGFMSIMHVLHGSLLEDQFAAAALIHAVVDELFFSDTQVRGLFAHPAVVAMSAWHKAVLFARMLPRVIECDDASVSGKLACRCLDEEAVACLEQMLHSADLLVEANPTGSYQLDLSHPVEREIARWLMRLNAKEAAERAAKFREVDGWTSQDGSWNNFRNMTIDGKSTSVHSGNPTFLAHKGVLVFDYVSTTRPAPGATEMSHSRLRRFVKAVGLVYEPDEGEPHALLKLRAAAHAVVAFPRRADTQRLISIDPLVDEKEEGMPKSPLVASPTATTMSPTTTRPMTRINTMSKMKSVVSKVLNKDIAVRAAPRKNVSDSEITAAGKLTSALMMCTGLESPTFLTPWHEAAHDDEAHKFKFLRHPEPPIVGGAKEEPTVIFHADMLKPSVLDSMSKAEAASVVLRETQRVQQNLKRLHRYARWTTFTAAQAAEIVRMFPVRVGGARARAVVALFSSIVDLDLMRVVLQELPPADLRVAVHRLGWLNLMHPVSPDYRFLLSMERADERRVAHMLARLQRREGVTTWSETIWNGRAAARFVAPEEWLVWSTMPTRGTLALQFRTNAPGVTPAWRERLDMECLVLATQEGS